MVAVDRVESGSFKVLKAAASILFAAHPKRRLETSRNEFEEAFFKLLGNAPPPGVGRSSPSAASRGRSSRASVGLAGGARRPREARCGGSWCWPSRAFSCS